MTARMPSMIVRRRQIEERRTSSQAFRPLVPPRGFVSRAGAGSLATFCADTDERVFALTYDDGPHPEHTPRILDVLARHEATATFYVLMRPAIENPDIIRRIVAEGHELAIHGMDHRSLLGRHPRDVTADITTARRRVEAIADTTIASYRPPYGRHTGAQARAIRRTGLDVVVWSGDAFDWVDDAEDAVADRAFAQIFPGAILLLHDDRADPENLGAGEVLPGFDRAAVVDDVLRRTVEAGYRTRTVAQILTGRPAVRSIALERRRA